MLKITFPDQLQYQYDPKGGDEYFVVTSSRTSDQARLSFTDVARFYKGAYGTKGRLERAFKGYASHSQPVIDRLMDMLDDVEPFTYKEAFEIKDQGFRAIVFGTVDITEMIEYLGHVRHETDGINVNTKVYNPDGSFNGYEEKHNIFEVHEIYGDKLEVSNFYAVKCWCTSTNQEHWVYIEEQYKDDPLEAIASTFRVPEDIIPHIKEIKRQGDVLLLEMKEDVKPDENARVVPLGKEKYFELLTCET